MNEFDACNFDNQMVLIISLLENQSMEDYSKVKDRWFTYPDTKLIMKYARSHLKNYDYLPLPADIYFAWEKDGGEEKAQQFFNSYNNNRWHSMPHIELPLETVKFEWENFNRVKKAQDVIDNGGKKKERPKPVERSKPDIPKGLPYMPLGYDRDKIYLMTHECQQIQEYSTSVFGKKHLISIKDLHYWEACYPTDKGVDWDIACSDVIRQCRQCGLYDIAKTRGRGVWSESSNVVINLGDRLIVNGGAMSHSEHISSYNYELALPLSASNFTEKMTQDELHGVFSIISSIDWDNSVYGQYFAGWIVSAVICGGLNWRPHMWLTGTRGAGKSWVLKNVASPLIGEFAVYPQGETTEAGLRQTLNSDALAVVFDEAEGERKEGKQRVENVLQLARQSSSETGGKIIKGSSGGSSKTFCIRSSFLFASIGIAMTNSADESRVTIVSLKANEETPESEARFERFNEKASMKINADTGKKFRASVISLLPVIKENIKTMIKACCGFTADRRSADQIGTLLACSLVFETDSILSHDEAVYWCSKLDWTEHKEGHAPDDTDEDRCLEYIMHSLVRNEDNKERSILDLCRRAHFDKTDRSILERRGLRYKNNRIIVANRSPLLAKMLESTSWHSNWGKTLKRIRGAEPKGGYKMNSKSVRVVSIPYEIELEVQGLENSDYGNEGRF